MKGSDKARLQQEETGVSARPTPKKCGPGKRLTTKWSVLRLIEGKGNDAKGQWVRRANGTGQG